MENLITSVIAPKKPQKSKKSKLIKILLAFPDVRPAYQGVNKLADNKKEKYVVPAKYILRQTTFKPKAEPINETKSIDLALIGATLF